jgi:hypothetical protein
MRIALLDPSLRMLEGHFTDLDLRLAQAWTAAGHEVTVYVRTDAPQSLDPLFDVSGIRLQRSFPVPPQAWYARDVGAEERLRRIGALYSDVLNALDRFDLAVWPTATVSGALGYAASHHIAPVAFGYFEHPIALLPSSLAIAAEAQQRLDHKDVPALWGHYVEDFACIWQTALRPGSLVHLPYPTIAPARLKQKESPLQIGLIGAQRAERHADLTIPVAQALLAQGHAVILQDSSGAVPDFTHERLTRHGFLADLSPVFAASDLIIWAANPWNYMGRPSGIVAEAIASGVALVMSAGCYPSQMASQSGSVVFFQKAETGEIAAAVARAAAKIDTLRRTAGEKAAVWNRANGITRLAEQFLGLAR